VQGKVLSSRGLRRGLMVTTLVFGVALFAGPSMATHGGGHLSINDVTVTPEGNGGTKTASFTVTLDLPPGAGETVTINYATADGSATLLAGDYVTAAGVLTFDAGETTKPVDVTINGDTTDEVDETFNVTLSTPSLGTEISDDTGVGTIDDDDGPSVSIENVSVGEADGNAVFGVSISASSPQQVTANYSTANVSAANGSDYTSQTDTVIFPAGTTADQTIIVPILNDSIQEPIETFHVNLTTATDATIADGQGVGTITDDEPTPTVAIADAGGGEGGNVVFNVTLSGPSSTAVTATYTASDNPGSADPGDLTGALTGTVTFNAGTNTTQQVTIATAEDAVDEPGETFTVTLSNLSANAVFGDPTATGTINDNDATPTVAITDASETEGGNVVFNVSLSGPSSTAVTATYTASDTPGSADPGDLSGALTGTVTFPAGTNTTQQVTIATAEDAVDEPGETFTVTLSNLSANAVFGDPTATGTINDNDATPTISINDTSASEGASSSFTVSLSNPSSSPVTVDYSTTHGSTASADFTGAVAGTVTFPAEATTQTVTLATVQDTIDEPSETFTVTLANASLNASILDGFGSGTIVDDDNAPTISINDAGPTEGGNALFTVSLSNPSSTAVTVDYATTHGSTSPADFSTPGQLTGTVTFPVGSTAQTITLATFQDAIDEPDETFVVTLANASLNASILDGSGAGTIVDDDAEPTISISNAPAIVEGAQASFNVTLSAPSGKPVTVNYSTGDETAAAPGDYTAVTGGTITFLPGPPAQTTQQIQIQTSGDALDENPETFRLTLAAPVNATIAAPGFGSATLNDDPADLPPTISIANVAAVAEGSPAVINVTLSAPSGKTVTVNYTHAHVTTNAADFTGALTGTVTLNPLDTSEPVNIETFNDTIDEADTETFTVTIAGPVNATLGAQTSATGTISDNDELPVLSISGGRSAVEGTATTLGTCAATPPAPGPPPEGCVYFTVTPSAASGREVRVQYSTADGTTEGAADYLQVSGQTLIFPAGSVAPQTIGVRIERDASDEPDEIVLVNLSSPTNATISPTAGQGPGTIIDDDGPPELSVQGSSDSEAHPEGATNVLITVLPASQLNVVSVRLRTIDQTARGGVDYGAVDQIVTFPTGVGVQTISIPLLNDGLDEEDETFVVQLSQPQNATIKRDQGQLQDRAVVRIRDDDPAPTVSIGNSTVSEGNSGTVSASFTVTLSTASGLDVSVAYASAGGSAAPAEDFTATSGLLSFPPGQTSKTVNVAVHGDVLFEPDESFFVNLTNPLNATIADGQGAGMITNDDLPPPPPDSPPLLPPPPPPPADPGPTTTTSTSTSTSTSTTTSTGTTTTNAAPTRLDGMGISSAPVKLLDDLAPVAVACSKQAKDTCFGTVLIQGRSARTLVIVNGRPTAKTVTLGRESFAIRRGRTEKVLVRLSIRAVRAVKRAGKLRVNVVVTARDSAGRRAKPISRALWLKAAKTPREAKKTSARR
jgi:hypothetical protein